MIIILINWTVFPGHYKLMMAAIVICKSSEAIIIDKRGDEIWLRFS